MPEKEKQDNPNNNVNQELLLKATIMERQSRELEQNLQIVDQQIRELNSFSDSLKSFDSRDDKEIFAPFGKGVYSKATLHEKDLLVNVGAGVFVKKSPNETIAAIDSQLSQLKEARRHLSMQLEAYAQNFRSLLAEFKEK